MAISNSVNRESVSIKHTSRLVTFGTDDRSAAPLKAWANCNFRK